LKKEWDKKEISFVRKLHARGASRFEIAKLFYEKFLYQRSPDSIRHCVETHAQDVELYVPRVLILDIESAPMEAYVWGLFDQNIPLNMLKKDWFTLSWTAKWLGEDEIFYKDQRNKKGKALENDGPLLKPLWKLMDEADAILAQNGNSFDFKKLNAKFLENGLGVPSAFKKIDTYRLAKKHFAFTSNKLEYMSKKFNKKYKKQDHAEFSGFKLWDECLKGNIKAWRSMERYNQFDVLATEELFLTLAPFDKTRVVTDALRAYRLTKKKK
jgi:hypothetical protein